VSHLLRRCSASPAVGRRVAPWLLVAAFLIAGGLSLDAPSPAHALARLAQCTNNLDDDSDGKIDFRREPGCASANDANEADPVPLPACSDGVDNDLDGKTDFPQEPGCPSAGNNNEADPMVLPACSDGVDNNDADGKIDYPADPGCNWAADNAEADRACSDDLDNDADGKPDFPLDFGCDNDNDMNESDPPQCNDGRDNDGDGTLDSDTNILTQSPDPDCVSAVDTVEAPALALCADGADNDADGKVDYPADPGCLSATDDDETDPQAPPPPPRCADHVDNDADGKTDYPADPGCLSATDDDETDPQAPPPPPPPPAPPASARCADGADNDADGKTDYPADPGCLTATDDDETDPLAPAPPRCADHVDNDADGKTDYPADPGCLSATDDDETDPDVFFVLPSSVLAPLQTPLLSPFPIVRLRGRSDRGRVRITLLTVRAPAASQVSIYCTGRSCPRKRLAIRAGSKIVRVRQFERRLRGGTVLKIYVTKPGFVGKYTRFRFMSHRVPLRADRCANTPGAQPSSCPS
jgi:hypothetical protein